MNFLKYPDYLTSGEGFKLVKKKTLSILKSSSTYMCKVSITQNHGNYGNICDFQRTVPNSFILLLTVSQVVCTFFPK